MNHFTKTATDLKEDLHSKHYIKLDELYRDGTFHLNGEAAPFENEMPLINTSRCQMMNTGYQLLPLASHDVLLAEIANVEK